ncbi:hypothetical protein GG344DRAFT_70355 [Lentinula edodes]|nr:hypothetical protein GG344DRAFT_70355 [Lentinula edodes]
MTEEKQGTSASWVTLSHVNAAARHSGTLGHLMLDIYQLFIRFLRLQSKVTLVYYIQYVYREPRKYYIKSPRAFIDLKRSKYEIFENAEVPCLRKYPVNHRIMAESWVFWVSLLYIMISFIRLGTLHVYTS